MFKTDLIMLGIEKGKLVLLKWENQDHNTNGFVLTSFETFEKWKKNVRNLSHFLVIYNSSESEILYKQGKDLLAQLTLKDIQQDTALAIVDSLELQLKHSEFLKGMEFYSYGIDTFFDEIFCGSESDDEEEEDMDFDGECNEDF